MKASAQNLIGKEAAERRVSPISVMCLCFLSIDPFCSCVRAYETVMDAKISGELFET